MMRDMVRHRAEHALGARHASVADDDHLRAFVVRNLHQCSPGLPRRQVCLALDAELRQLLLRSVENLLGVDSLTLSARFHQRDISLNDPPARRVLAVGAYHMHRRAEGACERTSTVDRPLGCLRAVCPDDDRFRLWHLTPS